MAFKRYSKIIIEGVDNLGKGTLIKNIRNNLGYYEIIHFQRPELLDLYKKSYSEKNTTDAYKLYQFNSFKNGFELLQSKAFIIFDRFHLGEIVYAPRYRGYNGEYVFDIEKMFRETVRSDDVLLILLTTSNFDFIIDDGLSFDVSKRQEEQEDFKRAFEMSLFKNKLLIDVYDNAFGFRNQAEIFHDVYKMFLTEE